MVLRSYFFNLVRFVTQFLPSRLFCRIKSRKTDKSLFLTRFRPFNLKYVLHHRLILGDPLKRLIILFVLIFTSAGMACNKSHPPAPQGVAAESDPQIERLKVLIATAHYDQAARKAKDLGAQSPNSPLVPEALYLESYALIFGEKAYPEARAVLKQFLDYYPQNPHAVEAEQWIGDCHFWEANYDRALREYRKLAGAGKDIEPYALYQQGNCLLLKDKVGDALATYRSLVEKYPSSPSPIRPN